MCRTRLRGKTLTGSASPSNSHTDIFTLASPTLRMLGRRINTGYFSVRKITPLNASCQACAIIPGTKALSPPRQEPKH